jgi:hypothetical protein
MPKPTILRTQIQKFNKAELDVAELCARALWHGISYETGKKITSDAWLLDTFATPFYQITNASNKVNIKYLYVHELVVACVLYATFRDILTKRMTQQQIAEAQKLARECLAKKYEGC